MSYRPPYEGSSFIAFGAPIRLCQKCKLIRRETPMNKVKRSLFERGLAALLASVMFYVGSAVPVTAQSSTTTPQTQPLYDGETIFRGVLLDDGPIAKLFPEIWENPVVVGYRDKAMQSGSEEQATAARRALISALRAQDPTFLDRFGKEMQSGDHIRIQQALNEAGERMTKSIRVVAPDLPPYTDVYQQAAAALYLWVWAVVAAIAAIGVIVFVPPSCDPGASCNNSKGLQRDVMVDLVANRLGPAASTAP
jgi:SdpC family antimicrobial peptide